MNHSTPNFIEGTCKQCKTHSIHICPNCGLCEGCHVGDIVKRMQKADSATLARMKADGGKFAVLADLLAGEISYEEADKFLSELNDD